MRSHGFAFFLYWLLNYCTRVLSIAETVSITLNTKTMKTTTVFKFAALFMIMAFVATSQLQAQAANRPIRPGKKMDKIEDIRDRREDKRDRREDVRDRREDIRDRREDIRDARHQGGRRDKIEDIIDRREDVRDRKEDRRDRKEDIRDRREDRRDRRN